MILKKNDAVIFGKNGVCEIDNIEERIFSGTKRLYYILKPVFTKGSTLYVPVDNELSVSKMRKVLSEKEIMQLIHEIPASKDIWIDNDFVRGKEFDRILHQGNRKELIKLIKAVYHHERKLNESGKRKLHVVDENAMKEAEKILYEEFAYVLHVDKKDVLQFIIDEIEFDKN